MAAIGRNEPCPCGSGRKYKHCCSIGREAEERALLALRRTEDQAIEGVMEHLKERYEVELADLAWADFVGADEPEEPDAELEEFESVFFRAYSASSAGRRPPMSW